MRTVAYLLALGLALSSGCATAGLEFRPYLSAMPHGALLTRAVSVDRRDVPALAQAGAIVIGHISARGAGFSGPAALEEAASLEAARRGGTHLVVESRRSRGDQSTLRVELTFAVVRLTDLRAMSQLAAHLRPHRGVHYQGELVPSAAELELAAPMPPAFDLESEPQPTHAEVPIRVVDGRHLKPLR